VPIDPAVGEAIVSRIFYDPDPPYIEWYIWSGYIWTPYWGLKPFADDGTGLHYDHAHFTFS
jgi:hypothetical protein